jgi:phosphate starvation-inducible protein PhoH and related proteins
VSTEHGTDAPTVDAVHMRFDDNALLSVLFGDHDRHLARIEQAVGVLVSSRGNEVSISGSAVAVRAAESILDDLYAQLEQGRVVGTAEVDAVIRMQAEAKGKALRVADEPLIKTQKRSVGPRSPRQAEYLQALRDKELTFALGPAGTGKTYLAVAVGVSLYMAGKVDRIILSRPAVEAGERLGFLPGDIRDKVDPYLRPLYDALYDMLPAEQVARRIETGEIEIAPLAFMRGRTLANAFVILDEAQNTTAMQMKMFLTRLGEHSRMVVTGDLSQIDLPAGTSSGLAEAVDILEGMDRSAIVRFTDIDVVRNPLVMRIVRAYDAYEAKREPSGQR